VGRKTRRKKDMNRQKGVEKTARQKKRNNEGRARNKCRHERKKEKIKM
jgi:hypothetical protein